MAYNRYYGNSGRVVRVQDAPEAASAPAEKARPSPLPPRGGRESDEGLLPAILSGGLDRLLSRLSPGGLETEDILLLAIFYLLYRETGDTEFLIMLGSVLLP